MFGFSMGFMKLVGGVSWSWWGGYSFEPQHSDKAGYIRDVSMVNGITTLQSAHIIRDRILLLDSIDTRVLVVVSSKPLEIEPDWWLDQWCSGPTMFPVHSVPIPISF